MTLLLLLSSTTAVSASFRPDVRIDHEYNPTHVCRACAIAIGPGAPSGQPVYVVFEDDSVVGGGFRVRTDVMFQRSTDAGRTWLPADLLIQRGDPFADSPDVTTDSAGNVYIVYAYHDTAVGGSTQVSCVRSSDGGTTWSGPAKVHDESVGLVCIAADLAGNLFVAWNQRQATYHHVFSSVSTDEGATWSPRVRVDNDTLIEESYHPAVCIQPGTNHYLVAATTYRTDSQPGACAYLYRSTDRGQTFEPGVQLDTFNWSAGWPHVVADRDHIICDYFGEGRAVPESTVVEARTFYTQADSWGSPVGITELDSLHELYYGGALALSGDGRVHTAQMVKDTADSRENIYYTSSSDHGASWADLELVTDDTTVDSWYPDIGADIAGYAYLVWYEFDAEHGIGTEWFSTNSPAGIAEQPTRQPISVQPAATVTRNVLFLTERPSSSASTSSLLDISGRDVMDLKPGANDVQALAPGVYFVREAQAQTQAVHKVVIAR